MKRNHNFKRILAGILSVIVLLSYVSIGACAVDYQQDDIATISSENSAIITSIPYNKIELPPSEEYLKYLENPSAYGEVIPEYFSYDDLEITYMPEEHDTADADTLPAKYDSRDYGYVPSVKNQKSTDTCVTFSTIGNIEILTQKNEGTATRFSENHLKHAHAKAFTDITNPYGFDRDFNGGSHYRWTTPYLFNGIGPVLESTAPFDYSNTNVSSSYVFNKTPKIRVNEIQAVPYASSSQSEEWLTEVKKLIMEHGSAAITMSVDHSDSTGKYFYSPSNPGYHNHAVIAIGWDDTIPASKFTNKSGNAPTTNGGLIFRNSWGSSWGDSGYGYISYATDGISKAQAIATTSYRDYEANETIHSYAEHGMQSAFGYERADSEWFGSKYFLSSNEFVELKEVMFYSIVGNMDYEVYVSTKGSLDRNDFKLVGSGTTNNPGYYSVPVKNTILGSASESEYLVFVKMLTKGKVSAVIPVESVGGETVGSVTDYISYTENGVRKVVSKTDENISMINGKSLSYTDLVTDLSSADNYEFEEVVGRNVSIAISTSPASSNFSLDDIYIDREELAAASTSLVSKAITSGDTTGVEYNFNYIKNGVSVFSSGYLSNDSYSTSLPSAGEWIVEVTARKNGVTLGTVRSESISVYNEISGVSIGISKSKSMPNSEITATVTASGNSYLYALYRNDILQNVTDLTTSAFSFTPSVSGVYMIEVTVKNSAGEISIVQSEPIYIAFDSVSISHTSTVAGVPITVTAKNSANIADLVYSYTLYENGAVKDTSAYSSENTYTFTPQANGNYYVVVSARIGNTDIGSITSSSVSILDTFEIDSVVLDTNQILAGERMYVTINVDESIPITQYEAFILSYGDDAIQRWVPSGNKRYYINTAGMDNGEYYIQATATVSSSNKATANSEKFVIGNVAIRSIALSSDTLNIGEPVTATVTADKVSTVYETLRYSYTLYKNGVAVDTVTSSYNNTYTFTPNEEAEYYVQATASISSFTTPAFKSVVLKAEEPVQITSINLPSVATIGEPVSINVQTSGNTTNVKYIYEVICDGSTVSTSALTAESAYTFVPASSGNYQVRVTAYNSSEAVDSKLSDVISISGELSIEDYAICKLGTSYGLNSAYGTIEQSSLPFEIKGGKSFFPARIAAMILDLDIAYNDTENTVTVNTDYGKIVFTIGGQTITRYNASGTVIDTQQLGINEVPYISNGRAYIPARVMSSIAEQNIYYFSSSSDEQPDVVNEYIIFASREYNLAEQTEIAYIMEEKLSAI